VVVLLDEPYTERAFVQLFVLHIPLSQWGFQYANDRCKQRLCSHKVRQELVQVVLGLVQ
jgi:hypothetical protein